MQLRQIADRTYAIESDFASLGIFLLNDRDCLLIDSGHSAAHAREVLRILEGQSWSVHAIFNTHGHADHCGGNRGLQESTGCEIYATPIEAAFIENPLLLPYSTYSAYPPKLLMGKFFMPQASRVTHMVESGPLSIKGSDFVVVPLEGHSLGQMGLTTPDGVLFAGDSLVSQQILEALPFVFLADVARQFATLEMLKSGGYEHLYLSHGGLTRDSLATIKSNHTILLKNIALVESIITKPHSLEGILKQFIIQQNSTINRNHYFRLSNAVCGILAYLVNQGKAAMIIQDNIPHYHTKRGDGSCV